ncbi:MAG: glutamate--cysteine ligase [Rhodospirillales bacterium]|nr:glutamate--cysteine ligase [Rhodospirillales bacterium]
MAESAGQFAPISNKTELVDYLASGCKSVEQWRIGTEHEKFGYQLKDLRPLPYEGECGIRAMLDGLQRYGWTPVFENGNPIALVKDGASVSLEPGGQLELSGAPLDNLHQTCDEVHTHLAQVKDVAEEMGAGFLGLGFQPRWGLDDIPVMPKDRYNIMRNYMPTRGELGLDMMFRSCTVQVNLDFSSEADMVRKFRVGLALQPIATALFANSPFTDGQPNGFLSYRSHIWTDTDSDRCGMLRFVFDDGMSFERYVDYALDVPMYFVYRDGYINAAGQSFRDFLAGKLPALPGQLPTLTDWENHLTTLFPEVRLKRYIEMRGADGGPWHRLCALPAFWVGLLYDQTSLDEVWDIVRDWTPEERDELREQTPKMALNTPFRNGTILDLAKRILPVAAAGLQRRDRHDPKSGRDEVQYLGALEDIIREGRTPAEELLEAFHGRWKGSVDPVFKEYAY